MSDYLCEELIVEILRRVPPKSLLRFRSVSKSLRSCIDSPGFISVHTSRSPQRLVITHVVKHKYKEEYRDTAFCTLHAEDRLPLCPIRGYLGITAVKFPLRDASIVASCNGILCLLNSRNGVISLWNPSIMRQLAVPDCPRRCIYGLGFGLGFDPITDDIKIVSIPIYGNGNGGIVESSFVYAVKSRAWRPIASPMPSYSKVLSRACYHNGVLHWVVERCCTISKEVELRYVMTLDLSTHVFGMISLPKPCWKTCQVTTIQGSLAVISTVSDDSWIWVRDTYASWSVIFKSKSNQVQAGVRRVMELTNGDLLLDTFCEGFLVYNLGRGVVRSSLVNFNNASFLYDMRMYVESLHLLEVGNACEVNHLLLQDKKRKRISDS